MAESAKYHVITFGCQMNERDSEVIAGLLESVGMERVADIRKAAVTVVNTCHVREHAEQRALSLLGRLGPWRKAKPGRTLVIAGCVAAALGEELLTRFPQLDVVVAPARLMSLPSLIARAATGERVVAAAGHDGAGEEGVPELPGSHPSSFSAWIKVMEGCDLGCTYCVVPSVRGHGRFRELGGITAEAEALAARGTVEVTLLGQTVNSWRDGEKGFGELIKALDGVGGLRRVRFMSPHPSFMGSDVLEAMAASRNACRQLHLPVQSGSDRVLKAMHRGYTCERFLSIVRRARDLMPGLAVTTDFIVGFPGETEEDFEATLALAREAALDGAFTFKFSARPGTAAAGVPDDVSRKEKQERLARLNQLLDDGTRKRNGALVGTMTEVLVEGPRRKQPGGTVLVGGVKSAGGTAAPAPDARASGPATE